MPATEVMPPAMREKLRFRLNELLIRDESDYETQFANYAKLIDEMCKFEGKLTSDPHQVLAYLKLSNQANDTIAAVIMYRYLDQAIDTRKTGLVSMMSARLEQLSAKTTFAELELKSVDEATWKKWVTQLPELAAWDEFHRRIRRGVPFTLSLAEEELLAKLGTPLTGWQSDLYETLVSRTKFEEFEVDGKKLNAMRDGPMLMRVSDRSIREKAFHALYAGYNTQRDLYAFSLSHLVSTINLTATLSKFDDALHAQAHSFDLSREYIDGLFASIDALSPLYLRYSAADCKRRKKLLGYDTIEPWDMEMEGDGFELPVFEAKLAFDVIRSSLSLLGTPASQELNLLLDPEQGRVDMYGGPNRTPGAFSINVGNRPGFFYLDQYHGTINQVRTIAHESGHTVHYALMKKTGKPLYMYNGPTYVTETAAMTFEEFVLNYLISHENDAKMKSYYEFIQLRGMTNVIRIGLMAKLEKKIYEAVRDRDRAGKGMLSPEEFDEITEPILKQMSIFYPKYKQQLTMWQYIPHLYGSPQYLLNYLISSLLTMELMGRLAHDANFAKEIAKLFSHPFDRPVAALLADTVGIKFDSAGWWSNAEKALNERVTAYEKSVESM